MSDDINYHFPDFLLANQSKNVFAKHAVDLANKCVPQKIVPLRLQYIPRPLIHCFLCPCLLMTGIFHICYFQIFYIIIHKKTVEKLSVLYYNRDKERVDRI